MQGEMLFYSASLYGDLESLIFTQSFLALMYLGFFFADADEDGIRTLALYQKLFS
jgi:hypothetical protein